MNPELEQRLDEADRWLEKLSTALNSSTVEQIREVETFLRIDALERECEVGPYRHRVID